MFNPHPNDKIFALAKLKAFADNQLNVINDFERGRKHCEKRGKMLVTSIFSSFPSMFSKGFSLRVVKVLLNG